MELRNRSTSFRAFYWRMEGLRVLVAGLVFVAFRETLGVLWLLGAIVRVTVAVEIVLNTAFVLPRAELERATRSRSFT